MANFTVEGTKTKKLYVNKGGVKTLIRKLRVKKDDVNKVCYALPQVTYTSSYNPSFTTKDVLMGDTYGTMPTFSTTTKGVDFWFYPDQVAADGSTKYAVNPWAAYADANSDLKTSYGYYRDELAIHWDQHGAGEGYSLGGITSNTKCEQEDNHELQHISTTRKIPFTFSGGQSVGTYLKPETNALQLYSSLKTINASATLDTSQDTSLSTTVYPGMTLIINAPADGYGSYTPDPWIKINGVIQKNSSGTVLRSITYTIPDGVKSIHLDTVARRASNIVSLKPYVWEYWQATLTVET